jgi:hypothetical protein
MKKYRSLFISAGLIAFVILMAGFGGSELKTSTGAPPGNTNSPADGQNCTHCMGGTAVPVTGWITSDIPTDGYYPDSLYTITVTATGTGKKGFEVSPQDLPGNLIGTLTAGTGNKLVGVNKYVTHSSAQSADPYSWTFKWKAPATGVGDVTFYGSIVVGKLNTKTTTLTVSQSTVGIPKHKEPGLSIFPNPAYGRFSVSFTLNEPCNVKMDLIDLDGKNIQNLIQEELPAGEFTRTFSVDQPAGLYFLRMNNDGKELVKRIIIE